MYTPAAPPAHMGIGLYSYGGTLYSASPNIYRRLGTSWTKLVDAQVGNLWQSSSNNIIAVGRAVWHFNGIDWMEFSQLYLTYGSDCFTDGKEVFIVGNDGWRSFIVHGK